MKKHSEKWFISKVGKHIQGRRHKIKVYDIQHAKYLFLCQNELNLFYANVKK